MPDQVFLQGVAWGVGLVVGLELTLAGLLAGWLGWLWLGEREWPRLYLWPPEAWGIR